MLQVGKVTVVRAVVAVLVVVARRRWTRADGFFQLVVVKDWGTVLGAVVMEKVAEGPLPAAVAEPSGGRFPARLRRCEMADLAPLLPSATLNLLLGLVPNPRFVMEFWTRRLHAWPFFLA